VILFELVGTEDHPVYEELEISNGNRQYDFLRSVVLASLKVGKPFLSQHVIKALNFQAITCLHTNAGEYRPCPVIVGDYEPPAHYRVTALMDDFVNTVNRIWDTTDGVVLAAYVLWRLNAIHPFINGNGRTARAAAYFVLCLKAGGWIQGEPILPELLKAHRPEYVAALKAADQSYQAGNLDLSALHALLTRLLETQTQAVPNDQPAKEQPDANDGEQSNE
jgi:Fic family protein